MESQPDDRERIEPDAYVIQAGYALGGDGGCIAQARHHAADFLTRARVEKGLTISSRAMDLTRLVVSELITNALKYAPGPILMELRITDAMVEVVIWDSDPTVPTAKTADPGRIGQHGLEIVKAVAHDLVIERQSVGKQITAGIALTDTVRS
ncbi:ATP-binding protein [Streptomyces lacrimifluminis]|uniref:ATP-binding protein n=1 Tax=Streptomyces lacrimifluminis TaxID=1500077 RepID=UPI0033797A27